MSGGSVGRRAVLSSLGTWTLASAFSHKSNKSGDLIPDPSRHLSTSQAHQGWQAGTVPGAGSRGWGSVQCWNTKGCRCIGRVTLPKLARCLLAQCLALLLATSLESHFLAPVRWKLWRKNRATLAFSFMCSFYSRCMYLEGRAVCMVAFCAAGFAASCLDPVVFPVLCMGP